MAEQRPRKRYRQHFETCPRKMFVSEGHQHGTSEWFFSREEIENNSPSRKDGIDIERESYLRVSYCSFLQKLGMKLCVSQVTIACAMLLCHRFYMRQSHAKNDWQTVAAASMFLACKIEDAPFYLCGVVTAAYELIHEWDPSAPLRILQREFYDKQKELILVGERLLLDTIAFDLDVELPYKPLVAALNRLNALPDIATAAWNFVNDWLRTTLCLQYKPHIIAAASVFLAAKFQKVELSNGKDWWLEFDVSTKQLTEVIQQMCRPIELERRCALPPANRKFTCPITRATTAIPAVGIYSTFQGHYLPSTWQFGRW